ncbi:MOZ/SAS family protein [Spraguea lophii 42_110]|uniref:histone acetyltransferase n=1 Tax=Spraguea lophii (strain 42_110) TaxID=1358809 RepID=S7W8Y7_SPRLO|nr:MOZ/SAS family protein [Spraguea lophii 42_110]
MAECSQCLKIIRKHKEQCLGCGQFFHDKCIEENTKSCFKCLKCSLCGNQATGDNIFICCLECKRYYHKKCNNKENGVGDCVLCIEDKYKSLPIETLFKIEVNNLNTIEKIEDENFKEKTSEILRMAEYDMLGHHKITIFLGKNQMNAIYKPPYTFSGAKIYLCHTCLEKYDEELTLKRHRIKCEYNTPPGKIIYEEKRQDLKVFEIDGKTEKIFCRNLCILGKAFIGHKTLYYDVELFVFYVLTSNGEMVGYFSREKESISFNLSCVVVLPCYQGMGFGYFLVDLSYNLFQALNKIGTPEKPLSDSAQFLYNRYWMYKLYNYLEGCKNTLSLQKISSNLSMTVDDVIIGLELLGFLKKEDKYKIKVESKRMKPIRLIDKNLLVCKTSEFK